MTAQANDSFRKMVVNSRNESDATRTPVKNEITRFVERAFDRTYRMSGIVEGLSLAGKLDLPLYTRRPLQRRPGG